MQREFANLPVAMLFGALAWAGPCQAQAAAEAVTGTVEVGGLQHSVSAGLGDWRHQFLRASLRTGAGNTWDAELVRTARFGDHGTLLVLANTHQFDARWYSNASISGSSGGFYLPRLRVDVAANRKWGEQSKLVTTVGFTSVNAKDAHSDRSILLGMAYYFDVPLVVQGGLRLSRSNPGAVASQNGYAAVTWGWNQRQLISLVHSRGNEAYQIIGANTSLVDFDSRTTTATWRQWLRPRQGFQLRAEAYHNPYYQRHGVELALFQEF